MPVLQGSTRHQVRFFYPGGVSCRVDVAAGRLVALYMGGGDRLGERGIRAGLVIYLRSYHVFLIYIWTRGISRSSNRSVDVLRLEVLLRMLVNTCVGGKVLIGVKRGCRRRSPCGIGSSLLLRRAKVYRLGSFIGHGGQPRSERNAVLTRDVGSIRYVPGSLPEDGPVCHRLRVTAADRGLGRWRLCSAHLIHAVVRLSASLRTLGTIHKSIRRLHRA